MQVPLHPALNGAVMRGKPIINAELGNSESARRRGRADRRAPAVQAGLGEPTNVCMLKRIGGPPGQRCAASVSARQGDMVAVHPYAHQQLLGLATADPPCPLLGWLVGYDATVLSVQACVLRTDKGQPLWAEELQAATDTLPAGLGLVGVVVGNKGGLDWVEANSAQVQAIQVRVDKRTAGPSCSQPGGDLGGRQRHGLGTAVAVVGPDGVGWHRLGEDGHLQAADTRPAEGLGASHVLLHGTWACTLPLCPGAGGLKGQGVQVAATLSSSSSVFVLGTNQYTVRWGSTGGAALGSLGLLAQGTVPWLHVAHRTAPAPVPLTVHHKGAQGARALCVRLQTVAYVPATVQASGAVCLYAAAMARDLQRVLAGQEATGTSQVVRQHQPEGLPHLVATCWPADGTDSKPQAVAQRQALHQRLLLPSRPLLRAPQALTFTAQQTATGRLRDVHLGLANPQGGEVGLVRGSYEYYHYGQDGLDDRGWGCAYRALQTLVSHLLLGHVVAGHVPSHRTIQQALVQLGDRESSIVGSQQWLGTYEACLVLGHLYQVDCRIVSVADRSQLPGQARTLLRHFATHGTPAMLGGGVLAHTVLGVWYEPATGAMQLLILDPHYTGADEADTVQRKGWCGWKDLDFLAPATPYNLCLPLCPDTI